MNETIKEEWKKNLKSGKFAQGSGQLRTWDPDEKNLEVLLPRRAV